ncbi:MAG TPA: adenylate/guanylate cyclase domain-containing protein [Thiothrix sp.]|nr:adenylate/guanylate cyclase domain-containing protein [Thiothrix sp.]
MNIRFLLLVFRWSLLILILGLLVVFYHSPLTQTVENRIWDGYRQLAEASVSYQPNTVIIDINPDSLKQLGDWPWSRQRLADMATILLEDYKAAIVGFDIVFPNDRDEAGDQALLALAQTGQLVLAQSLSVSEAQSEGVVSQGVVVEKDDLTRFPEAKSYSANHQLFAQAPCVGNINPKKEDGVIRHVPAFMAWQERLYPSFALEILRCFMGGVDFELADVHEPALSSQSMRFLSDLAEKDHLVLDKAGYLRVPYTIARQDIISIPAIEVFQKNVPDELLAGQIVLVGSSALGLNDIHATPQSSSSMGVEIHLQLIESFLSDVPAYPVGKLEWFSLIWLCLSLLIVYSLLFRGNSVFLLLSVSLSLAIIWLGIGYYFWLKWQWWLPMLPIQAYLLFLLLQMPAEWAMTQSKVRRLKNTFGGYLPAPLLDSLDRHDEATILAPRRRKITVLFADIANFTQLSEQLSPEKTATLTQKILSQLTKCVYDHQGTLDKYMGDAVMAFWNAPLAQTDHAKLALCCGVDMIQVIQAFEDVDVIQQDQSINKHPISIRIGIHTGEVIVGDLGTPYRHAYTAIGDAVNVAARLQEKAKELGEVLLYSDSVYHDLPIDIKITDKLAAKSPKHPAVNLRGRKKAVGIYTLTEIPAAICR